MISTNILMIFVMIYMGAMVTAVPGGGYSLPVNTTLELLVYAAFTTVLSIPFTILINRYVLCVFKRHSTF